MLNSRHPLFCATFLWLPTKRSLLSRSYESILPSSFNIIRSIALVYSTSPPVSVWGTVLMLGLFPGTPSRLAQSNQGKQLAAFVTSSRPRTINLVPIDYAFRPRLRGRLTLRGLTLRRNPWTFGGHVSHMPLTLLMSAFALPIPPEALTSLPSPAYGTLRYHVRDTSLTSAASVYGLSPDTFSAQDGLTRPVSYYAFFKGWLLLSQPPGCLGRPTSFPT